MSSLPQTLVHLIPQKWSARMKAESRSWMLRCPCGFERTWWDAGGIRWKAAGHPRRLIRCPKCGRRTWHTTYKKKADEARERAT